MWSMWVDGSVIGLDENMNENVNRKRKCTKMKIGKREGDRCVLGKSSKSKITFGKDLKEVVIQA